MTHVTALSCLLVRRVSRRGVDAPQAARNAASGQDNAAFGGAKSLHGGVAPLARCTASRCATRLAVNRFGRHHMGHYQRSLVLEHSGRSIHKRATPLIHGIWAMPLTVLAAITLIVAYLNPAFAQRSVDASDVEPGAVWDVLIVHVDAADTSQRFDTVNLDQLVGTDVNLIATVNAEVGTDWRPVSGANVLFKLGDQRVEAISDNQGRAAATIASGSTVGPVLLGANLVSGPPEEHSRTLNVYDYVVELPGRIEVDVSGATSTFVDARLRRREVDANGNETLTDPGRRGAIDMEAVRFIGDDELDLAGDNDRSGETRIYETEPPEDGPMQFRVRSETAGAYSIRAVGIGNRFRLRGDALGTMQVVVSDEPLGVTLEFGPSMQAHMTGPDSIRIEGVDINEDTPIELEIVARVNGRPSAGVDVRVNREPGADIQLAGDVSTSFVGDGSVRPSIWRPGLGPQTLTVSADGANSLTVVIVGVDEGEEMAGCGAIDRQVASAPGSPAPLDGLDLNGTWDGSEGQVEIRHDLASGCVTIDYLNTDRVGDLFGNLAGNELTGEDFARMPVVPECPDLGELPVTFTATIHDDGNTITGTEEGPAIRLGNCSLEYMYIQGSDFTFMR